MSTTKKMPRKDLEELAGLFSKAVMVSAIAARRIRKFEDPTNQVPAVQALLNLPFLKEKEVKCEACNGTGIWESDSKLHTGPCAVCWLGRVAGRPGSMTVLDVKGQAQFEEHMRRKQERENRFKQQAPARAENEVPEIHGMF